MKSASHRRSMLSLSVFKLVAMKRYGQFNKASELLKAFQRVVGFRKAHSLLLWSLFGGTAIHFAVTRITGIDIDDILCGQRGRSVPGECFFWQKGNVKARAGMILHLSTILPATTLAVLQFVPVIRRKALAFHRVNGYIAILLSILGVLGGLIVAQHAFGGTLELQSAMILSSAMFLACLYLSMFHLKSLRIEQHRAWMLRAWAVACHVITMRLLNKAMVFFPGAINTGRFVIRSCATVDYMFGGNETVVQSLYPLCFAYYTGAQPDQHVLIKTNMTSLRVDHVAANFGVTCASSAWIALALHCILVEVYLASTSAEAYRLAKLSHQRQMEVRRTRPRNAELSGGQFGSLSGWSPAVEKEVNVVSDSESSNG